MPKVSIVVPSYNYAHFLPRCLDSLVNQNLRDIEIIVVDDCSTDNTEEVTQPYLADGRVKYIKNEINQKIYASRIIGMKASGGEYITHCDADDFYELNAMELMYYHAQKTGADIVRADFVLSDENHSLSAYNSHQIWESPDLFSLFLKSEKSWGVCGRFYKKELIQKYLKEAPNISLTHGDDLLANVIIHYFAQKEVFIKDRLYNYRKNPNSTTLLADNIQAAIKALKDHCLCAEEILKFAHRKNTEKEHRSNLLIPIRLLAWYSLVRIYYSPPPQEIYSIWEEHASPLFREEIFYVLMEAKQKNTEGISGLTKQLLQAIRKKFFKEY